MPSLNVVTKILIKVRKGRVNLRTGLEGSEGN
jgi:hypothetical protein